MKIINVFLGMCLFILFAIPVYAEDICFDISTAQKLEVEVKQCREMMQTILLYEELQIKNEAEIKALNEKFEGCDKAVKQYEDLVKLKDKNCEEMLKVQKPSFFKRALEILGGIGIGILIGVLLL
jgi:hypothetical protein